MKAIKKDLGKSQLEVEFELTPEEFKKHIDRALLHLKSHVKMDGFRQGQVPLEIVEKKVGQESLLMEAGDLAVKESYTRYVNENNLEPIGNPGVQILKIPARRSLGEGGANEESTSAKASVDENFVFKVKFSVLPEIQLPDYKEIVGKIKGQDIAVDEKEIEDALKYLQKSRTRFTEKNPSTGSGPGDFVEIEYENENINQGKMVRDRFVIGEGGFMKDFEDNLLGMKTGDEKEFKVPMPQHRGSSTEVGTKFPENAANNLAGRESNFKVKMVSVQKMELPEINDEFAKSLGVFDGLVALKSNLKEGITMEKQEAEKQNKRGVILSKIAEKITFELPKKMIDLEKERLLEDLKSQVAQQFKITFEEYVTSVKKSEEEIKNNFKLDAEKRIKNYLVLRQIGKAENIEVAKEEIEAEMNKFIKNYTKEEAEKIDINQLKEYTKSAIYNEKVFQRLETFSI